MGSDPGLRLVHSREPERVDDLVARVAVGDTAAFERLYDALAPLVHGVALRVVRDPARAEDVTQEAFLDVWRKAPGFDATLGSARTWVLTIVHRRAVDAVRRNEALKKRDGRAVVEEVRHDEGADRLIRAEEHASVRSCLETLTELQMESVRLAYFNGYTYAEVATLLGKPLPTIKTRMRDGLIRLRDCLEGAR
jgi:RNA polymerase sigma-70 factor (ECF subfamily)